MDRSSPAGGEWELEPFRFRVHTPGAGELKVAVVAWPCPPLKAPEDRPSPEAAPSGQTRIHLVLQGADGTPFAGRRYKLDVEGKSYEGTTATDGVLDQLVPHGSGKGQLTLLADGGHSEIRLEVKLGELPPIE